MTSVIVSIAILFMKIVFGWVGLACLFAAFRYKKVAFVWLGLGFLLLPFSLTVTFANEWQRFKPLMLLMNVGFPVLFLLANRLDKDTSTISLRRLMLFR